MFMLDTSVPLGFLGSIFRWTTGWLMKVICIFDPRVYWNDTTWSWNDDWAKVKHVFCRQETKKNEKFLFLGGVPFYVQVLRNFFIFCTDYTQPWCLRRSEWILQFFHNFFFCFQTESCILNILTFLVFETAISTYGWRLWRESASLLSLLTGKWRSMVNLLKTQVTDLRTSFEEFKITHEVKAFAWK